MSESTPFSKDFESQVDSDSSSRHSPSTEFKQRKKQRSKTRRQLKDISLLLSVIGNLVIWLAFFIWFYPSLKQPHLGPPLGETGNPLVPPGIDQETYIPVNFAWEYYADTVADMAKVDRNWDAIDPDVGVVSALHQVADRWGVVPGQDLPSDPTRGLQTLQAYHSLHCLKIIRQTMIQLAEGTKPLDIPFGHSMHCLASLLQDVICYADDSLPLRGPYDWDENENYGRKGKQTYQYVRKCRNWSAMKKWVGPRTTCMTTSADGILNTTRQNVGENCTRDDGVVITAI